MKKNADITLINFILNTPRLWLPMASIVLTASLRKKGFSVDFRDFQMETPNSFIDLDKLEATLNSTSDIIGFSCYSHALPYVLLLSQRLKKKAPHKKVILGGIGASVIAAEILDAFEFVDAVAIGDGQESLPEFVECILNGGEDYGHIAGLAWHNGGRTQINPPRKAGNIVANSLIPVLEDIPLERYGVVPIVTGRGCPFKCGFCSARVMDPVYQKRDLEEIKEEISYLNTRENCPENIYLLDEAFITDRDRIYRFLDFSGQERFRQKHFSCYGRLNRVEESLMRDMTRNHFSSILYGFESGSNRILQKIAKGFTVEEAIENVKLSKKYFQIVTASFVYGYPFETKEDFLETLYCRWLLHNMDVNIHFNLLSPLPGTGFYKEYGHDLVFSKHLISKQCAPYVANNQINLDTVIDLVRAYPHIFPNYYHFRTEAVAFSHESARFLDETLEKNFFYFKKRQLL